MIDNGVGMNKEQLINGFMRLSSSDKIHHPKSPSYNRTRAGRKGIRITSYNVCYTKLLRALYACGSINHGNCDIRELTGFFEQIFNIRLPDIYRTYLEIKIRSTPTKYIDNLKTALLRKMEEDL